MNEMMLDPLMRPIGIPLVAGLLCLLLPKRCEQGRAWLAIAATTLTLLTAYSVFAGGNQAHAFAGWLLLRVEIHRARLLFHHPGTKKQT